MNEKEYLAKRNEIMEQTIKSFVAPSTWNELYQIVKEVWTRAYINSLPDEAFALILPGGEKDEEGKTTPRYLRKLPHHNEKVKDPNDDSTVDWPHLINALARLPQVKAPDDLKQKAERHLRGHYDRIKGKEKVTEKIREIFESITKGKVVVELDADRETVLKSDSLDGVLQWHVVNENEIVTIARLAKQFEGLGAVPDGWSEDDFNEMVEIFKGLEEGTEKAILHLGKAVDAISEYDAQGVCFIKVLYEDDPEVFNVFANVEKGTFVVISDRAHWDTVSVAKALGLHVYQVDKDESILLIAKDELQGVEEFDGNVAPKLKRSDVPEDRYVSKMVLPGETVSSLWSRVEDAVARYLERYGKAFFGYAYVTLYDIVDDVQAILRVFGEEKDGFYRVYYYLDSNGVTQINADRAPEPVYMQNVYVPTNSTVAPFQGETKRDESKDVEKREIVKRDVKVIAHEIRKQGGVEERYVLGIVLEPNDGKDGAPYNPDAQGDIYSKDTIRKAAFNWMRDYQVLGIMHAEPAKSRISVVESYLAPVDFEINGQKIVEGTWLLGAIVNDADLWEKVKKGEFTGWSIGGYATVVDENETSENDNENDKGSE